MQISVLGSGNAFQPDGRGAQSILIEPAESGAILVDAGPSTLLNWRHASCSTAQIDRVLFTHLHGDHIAGWPFLMLQWAFVDQRSAPVRVTGPQGAAGLLGTQDCLNQLVELCYREIATWDGFECRFNELAIASQDDIEFGGGWSLGCVPMQHHPTSLGYRLSGEESIIAVSGDTAWCDGLHELAQGVDWLFLECTHVSPGPGNHIDLATLRAQRSNLAAKHIVLVHLSDAVAAALAADPIPGVESSYDGWSREIISGAIAPEVEAPPIAT